MRFRFDRFEVDAAGYRLLACETPVAIQPKALELLILLLENRDRSVTKDEIFTRLWGDRAVGDAALSRCVYLARRALQDDGHRYLQTQYGRGFRFSPDVEVVVAGPGAGADTDTETAGPGAGADTDTAGPDAGADIDTAAAGPGAGADSYTATAGPPVRRRRLERRLALGLAVFLPLIVLAWWLPQWVLRREPTPEPATAGHRTVAILPATLPQFEPDSQLLLEALSESLSRSLAHYGWSVLELHWVEEVALTAPSLEEVAERTGASLLVSWSLARTPEAGKVNLVANLHELAGGSAQASPETLQISVPPPDTDERLGELQEAVAQLARDIVEPRSAPPIRAPSPDADVPPAAAMSTASRAYRFYLLGRRWLKDPSCEPGGLEELLARSLDLDPGFAPAWELAARFQHRLGRACMFGRAHLEEALTAAEQAATLDPASPSAQLLVGRLQLELGDPLGAYRRARNVREGFPQLPSAACLELRTLTYLGHPQAAEEARARCFAAAGGGDLGDDGVAPEISLYLGEPERFLAEMRAAPGLRARYSRGQALLLAGDEAAAEAQLAPLFSAAPGQLWARLAQALLAVVQDKPQEAIRVARALARNATAVGLQDGEVSYRIAQVLALAGDADGALDVLGTAVAQGFVCAACFRADRSLRELRNHPAFGSLVLAAEQRITPISALQDNAGNTPSRSIMP